MPARPASGRILHASCVTLDGRGVLILGAAGRGKSALALQLMAVGAELVADDQVALQPRQGRLHASAPPGLPPLIEARGVGLLRVAALRETWLHLVVDLDREETDRLPPKRNITLLDVVLPLVHGPLTGHLSAAIRQYVLWGRED